MPSWYEVGFWAILVMVMFISAAVSPAIYLTMLFCVYASNTLGYLQGRDE